MFQPTSIRAEMARRKVTIAELSARTGLATSAISKILRPDGNPTARNLDKIAKALGVAPALFFEHGLQNRVSETA